MLCTERLVIAWYCSCMCFVSNVLQTWSTSTNCLSCRSILAVRSRLCCVQNVWLLLGSGAVLCLSRMLCVPRPVFRSLQSLAGDRREVLVPHPNRGIARIRPSNTIEQPQHVRWDQAEEERAGEWAGQEAVSSFTITFIRL
jgi:hypothetical protein